MYAVYRCIENQRKYKLRIDIERAKNEDRKHYEIEIERKKRTTLDQQQQHDREEGEKKRHHEI